MEFRRSVRFDPRELDYLCPFLRFFGEELAEIGRRARKHLGAQVGKSREPKGSGQQ
jgi:hypothetical protein